MTTKQIMAAYRQTPLEDSVDKEAAKLLRLLSEQVPEARTHCGSRVLDQSDFRAWLNELAEEAERHA